MKNTGVYAGTVYSADEESIECAPPLATPLGYYGSYENETDAGLLNFRHYKVRVSFEGSN